MNVVFPHRNSRFTRSRARCVATTEIPVPVGPRWLCFATRGLALVVGSGGGGPRCEQSHDPTPPDNQTAAAPAKTQASSIARGGPFECAAVGMSVSGA